MNSKERIEHHFKERYVKNIKTNQEIPQLTYFDFGPQNWMSKDVKVATSDVSVADFLKIHALDKSMIDSRHLFIGFSKEGKNVEVGYDYVVDDFFFLMNKQQGILQVFKTHDLEEVVFECLCQEDLWEWLTQRSFFTDGCEF